MRTLLSTILVFLSFHILAQEKIQWLSFEEALEKVQQHPQKIIIDMYTDWCGWCVKMDNTTFSDPVIIKYINENFYAVKFDAERTDTVFFNGKQYINSNPDKKRSSHQLAQLLMNGRMSYPSYVFMNEELKVITVVPGYFPADKFEPVLHYFGKEAYQTTDWQTFNARFKTSY
ncbi:MAG: DUF255 domain-containing protein [Bacteroidales bacterium]|jgi:thioredoxin-related protein|nr:DUF255 domain-containing protein [Bacteroidales bacterium]MDD3700255.1 DUF255 domain-containing protein [Bacteroidales bacterium]MDY0368485.1 DUF255 domain-containing protein [Bacteroidales bacterium]